MNIGSVFSAILLIVGVGSFLFSIWQLINCLNRSFRKIVMESLVPKSEREIPISAHAEAKVLDSARVEIGEDVCIKDVFRMLFAIDSALKWTGVLPALCYALGLIIFVAQDWLDKDKINIDLVLMALGGAAIAFQFVYILLFHQSKLNRLVQRLAPSKRIDRVVFKLLGGFSD